MKGRVSQTQHKIPPYFMLLSQIGRQTQKDPKSALNLTQIGESEKISVRFCVDLGSNDLSGFKDTQIYEISRWIIELISPCYKIDQDVGVNKDLHNKYFSLQYNILSFSALISSASIVPAPLALGRQGVQDNTQFLVSSRLVGFGVDRHVSCARPWSLRLRRTP